jgi:dienelactone hydrolase
MADTRPIGKRPLLKWDNVGGFLCDWHLAGPFDAGLAVNAGAYLFEPKSSEAWTRDHLSPWGGCACIRGVPAAAWRGGARPRWTWQVLPLDWYPELLLREAALHYPAWKERLAGVNTDRWDKLYYALALVESPATAPAELVFCGWDGCRLWVNGRPAFEEHSYHHAVFDKERVAFRLRRGVNSFLFQLDRDGIIARVATPSDRRLLPRLRSVRVGEAPAPSRVGTVIALRRHAASLRPAKAFCGRTPAALRLWQRGFARHFRRCLGPVPPDWPVAAAPRQVGEVRRDGYVQRRYHLPAEHGTVVPAYVLVPDAERFNGRTLVIAHGHESHFEGVSGADNRPTDPHSPFRNYGQRLAQKGFLVAVACERAFSERNDNYLHADACNVAHAMAQAMGLTLPRLHILDLQRLLACVRRLPQCDPRRVGLTGLSGGGTLSYLAPAFDRGFRAAGVFCGMCRYQDFAAGLNGCGMQVVPGLYPAGDVGEVLSLIAPRPLLLAQGSLDSTFNLIRFRGIAADARRAWRAAGVPERLEVAEYPRPHQFDPDIATRFFEKWL